MSPREIMLREWAAWLRQHGTPASAARCALEADLIALAGLDLSPESLYAPCSLTRTALYGEAP